MECCELSISVGNLLGVPKVTLRGSMDSWHDQVVSGVLTGFRDEGTTSLVLDIAALSLCGVGGATSLVNALRSVGPEMGIHVVVSGSAANILDKAKLGPSVRLYSSTDELAEYISPAKECLTSRWMAPSADDSQLPLAA